MSDIREWLESHGLAKYAEVFAANEVELGDLPFLSEADLEKLGLPLGPRKRLLAAARPGGAPPISSAESLDDAADATSGGASQGAAERRQLTVMFCDLVGSVALGERMEVEDYRDLLTRFRSAVVEVVKRFDGFVARHQGDGLLVYFGYPHAKEDDAERAVRAGLEMVRAVDNLEHPRDTELLVRVGIATGPAVVGDVLETGASARAEFAALGHTPNLAARLQSKAEPNCVVISDITRRLVSGFFSLETLPALKLKGLADPQRAYRVVAALPGATRFSARTSGRLSALVGREEELEALRRRWRRALEGHGQVVLLLGDAGIGKSRLLQELREMVRQRGDVVQLHCSPYHEASALHPFIASFERFLGAPGAVPTTTRLERLRDHLADLGERRDDALILLGELLSIPTELRSSRLEQLDRQQRRERTLHILVEYLQKLAARSPTLLAIEDLHWADPSTRELLGRLVEAVENEPVLIVVTSRPGLEVAWSDLAHVGVMSLSRLGRPESERLARAVAAIDATLPADVVETILSRAGGNPLFIEELTRAMMQSDEPGRIEERVVPSTLQDSLMARLDALKRGKPVAQCASVIGREIPYRLLQGVWEGPAEDLAGGLKELEEAGMLYRRGEGDSVAYVFKHTLAQDAAYGNLLRERRIALHGRVAACLVRDTPETAEARPELLARHFSLAGLAEKAIEYWHHAGRRSLERSANAEAIVQVAEALALVEALPKSDTRAVRELELRLTLGPALMNVKGSASAEVGANYERARALGESVRNAEQRFTATWGLWLHHQMAGRFETARVAADEVISIARKLPDSTYLLQALHAAWTTDGSVGRHAKALEHAKAGVALYEKERHRRSAALYGDHDPGVCGNVHLSWGQWFLGHPDQSLVFLNRAIELGEAIEHPLSLALAQLYAAMLHQLRGEPEAVRRHAQALLENSERHKLPAWKTNAEIMMGWATATLGETKRGVDLMRSAIERRQSTGSSLRQTYYLALFAELLGSLKETDAALQAADQASKMLERTDERRWEPLVQRVYADLLIGRNDERAAAYLRSALDCARRQDAVAFELTAAYRLARLWRDQGRREDARALLVPIYRRITKGSDTPDLVKAKTLIDELS